MRWLLLLPALVATVVFWQGMAMASPPAQTAGQLFVSTASTAGIGFTYPGFNHQILVIDADLDVTPGPGNDFATVVITNVNAGTSTNFMAAEHTSLPGQFIGTFDNTTAPVSLQTNQTIRFEYNEANPATVHQITMNAITTVGTISVFPATNTTGPDVTTTVTDLDRNLNEGGGNDMFDITATNTTSGIMTPVVWTMMETGIPGQFQVVFPNNAPEFGVPAGNAIPAVGDIIEMLYIDIDTFGNPQNRTDTHEIFGHDGTVTATPGFVSPNGLITITVNDIDESGNIGGSNDMLDAGEVDVTHGGNTFTVDLDETTTAGVFTGVADLANLPVAPLPGDTVTITYHDNGTAAGAGIVDRTVDVTVRGTNGVLSVPSTVSLIGSMIIQVTDLDENITAGPSNDMITVDVLNPTTGFTATVTLNEGTTEGQFIGTFSDIDEANPPGLESLIGHVLETTYVDALASDGSTNIDRIGNTTVADASDATLVATPTLIGPGQIFTVIITDTDENITPGLNNDTVTFSVQNLTISSPIVNFNALESTVPGQFSLQVLSGDNGLNSADGHTLRVIYIDNNPSGGGPPKQLIVDITVGTFVFGSDATLTVTDTIPGRPINVTLNEPDFGNAASATLTVQNITNGGTVETLILANTGTSGIFSGSISTAFGTGPDGLADGIIAVKGGDVVRFSFSDAQTSSGAARTVTADANVLSRRSTALFCNQGTATNNPRWFAEYFANKDLSGSPAVVAEEFNLSVNWEETAPFRELPADGWSGRWTTDLVTQEAKYRFRIGADDGVRFFVDNQLFYDAFTPSPFQTATVDITLPAGNHTFKVEFFEDTGSAGLLVDCILLDTPVAAIDPSTEDARGGFDVSNIFASDYDLTQARAHVATGNLYVRANPHVTAARIDTVHLYESYRIEGVTEDNGWYLIDLRDGRTGWVATQFIYRAENTPVVIYPVWSGSEAPLPNIEVAGYATEELVIRTAPRGDEIGRLPPDVQVRIFARSQSGAWYRIEFDGIPGWVFSPYMRLTNGTVQDLTRE